MTTAYSINVDWSEEYDQWENIGQSYMRELFEKNPKEAEQYGYEVEDGEVRYLDEALDAWQPMMNYAYPLVCNPTLWDDGKEKIIRVCQETNLTVMYNLDDETYYLALTGGGMDLSQDIAKAYQILENWVPLSMLGEISKQPELSIHGKAWLEMAQQIQKQIDMEIAKLQASLHEWSNSIETFQSKVTTRK
jgi:hypothetical protein